MSTDIRPEISENNEFYISKERYYELKHFCLQYKEWKKALLAIDGINTSCLPKFSKNRYKESPVEKIIIAREHYKNLIQMVEDAARKADEEIHEFILLAVTENVSCSSLIAKYDMPCGKDKFYSAYRKFFYHLSLSRE